MVRRMPDGDEIYYKRPFMFNKYLELEAKGLLSDDPHIKVNNIYYHFVRHRFMNVHSIGYILTDLAALLLLRRGYAPLHCSAFKRGDSTVVIFAPPNTGKTLSTMMACMEHDAEFLAEDLAVTDGETVYSVPWTSTFRYYSRVEQGVGARTLNKLTRIFPPLELVSILEPKSVSAYIDKEAICDKSKITHIVILERGFEFNYHKAPLIVAYEFFNPTLNIAAACEAETDILKKLIETAKERVIIRTNDPTQYTSLALNVLK